MKKILLASYLILFSSFIFADDKFTELDALINTYLPTAHVGIIIQDADTREILYSHNAHQGFAPASLTKAFAAAASVLTLHPTFTYATELRFNKNSLNNNHLQSDVALKFTGDPSLSSEDLQKLLNHLSQNNIKIIEGDFIIDNTYFPKPETARGWVAEDLTWYFGAPAESVIVDKNQIEIILTPNKNINQNGTVALANASLPFSLNAQVKTVSPSEAKTLCQFNLEPNAENNHIEIYGCWPQETQRTQVPFRVALPNPELYVRHLILQSLKAQQITLKGQIRIGMSSLPDALATHQSPSLTHLLDVILKQSNNIYADSLTKVLGKINYDRATLQAGSFATLEILKNKINLDTKNIRLYDGSGGSIYNQITPQVMAQLLQAMHHEPKYFENMRVNADHTFYSRVPEGFNAEIYLKTGSMTGVTNYAGYVKTKNGKTFIVVSLINQLPLDKSMARKFEQQLLQLVSKG